VFEPLDEQLWQTCLPHFLLRPGQVIGSAEVLDSVLPGIKDSESGAPITISGLPD